MRRRFKVGDNVICFKVEHINGSDWSNDIEYKKWLFTPATIIYIYPVEMNTYDYSIGIDNKEHGDIRVFDKNLILLSDYKNLPQKNKVIDLLNI